MDLAREQMEWIVAHKKVPQVSDSHEPIPMISGCPSFAARAAPSDISDLRPQDVKVVGALGDSMSTACNALSTNWLNMADDRGISWSIGGDQGAVTLPNLIEQYSGSLVGPSRGKGTSSPGFNVALNGAVASDMPGQADKLISELKTSGTVDYENDWKVITLLIGGNDLCVICKSGKEASNGVANYEAKLKETLDKLSVIPRAMINLVSHLEYTQLAQYVGPLCGIVLPFVCDCLTNGKQADADRVEQERPLFNAVHTKLAPGYKRADFAVVVHPTLINAKIPERHFISKSDCFHPSGTGQEVFATGLWNSMLLTAAERAQTVANVYDEPVCATASSVFHL